MTTVVTAFYPIQSKFPTQQYLAWAERFLQLNAPIVLYTEPHLVDTFRAMRPFLPLKIVGKPFAELDMWALYETEWRAQHAMDHEAYHSPELYAIWAQKSVFVAEVVRENPFETDTFYWCDIGAFRDPHISAEILTTFPKADILRMVSPAILLNSVAPLEKADRVRGADGILGDFRLVNRIVGGLWGGTATACLRWRSAFEAQLLRYFAASRFAGKDQSVMLSAYLEDPTLAAVARATTREGDGWFFQQYLLTNKAGFEQDSSYLSIGPPPPPPVTVKLMGGLGNQMFQIATGWAYAKQRGGRLLLRAEKEEADGRPMYWASMLHRFQHVVYDSLPIIKPAAWEPAATEYGVLPPLSGLGMRLQGYFQSPKYFEACGEIRQLFAPSAEVLRHVKASHGNLLAIRERVVVVHARRGDYLKAVEHHGVLGIDYYHAAMEAMVAKVPDAFFLLVCEEPMWFMEAMQDLPVLQTHPFSILMEQDEVATLALLQQFRHFVIANSSFSWWAAWLSGSTDVIAPRQWFGPAGPKKWEDVYCAGWQRM